MDPVVGQVTRPNNKSVIASCVKPSVRIRPQKFVSILKRQALVAPGATDMPGYRPLPDGHNPNVYDVDGRVQRNRWMKRYRCCRRPAIPMGAMPPRPAAYSVFRFGSGTSSAMLDWMRSLSKLNIQLEIRATDYNRFQDKMRRALRRCICGWWPTTLMPKNFLFCYMAQCRSEWRETRQLPKRRVRRLFRMLTGRRSRKRR